jgi:DNA polymerase
VAYGKSFNVAPETVDKQQRQIGKVQELMLQYEGGVGAFVTGAATYRIDLDEMAAGAYDTLPHDVAKRRASS